MDSVTDPFWLQRIGQWADQLGYSSLWIRIVLAVVFAVAWLGLSRLALSITGRMVGRLMPEGRWNPPALRIQRQEILSSEEAGRVLAGITRTFGWAVILLLTLVFLQLLFGLFTVTQEWAIAIERNVVGALVFIERGVIGYLPNLIVIIVILLVVRFTLRVMKLVFDGLATRRITIPGFYPEWAHTTYNLMRMLIMALTLVVIFPYLPGSNSPAFQGLSIFFGVLLSLGSTSAVANVVSGIVLTYTRAFRPGDWILVAGVEGHIIERSMFVTRLETRKHEVVTLPNATVLGNHIVNYSAQAEDRGLILHTTVTIGYDVPWRTVHELLLAAAASVESIDASPAPFVLQKALGDYTVAYELNASTRRADIMPTMYTALHQAIQDRFAEAGVEITSPMYVATRDGNPPAIPPGRPPAGA